MNCKYCQKLFDDQGGGWYQCLHCRYWMKYNTYGGEDFSPILAESFTRTFNSSLFTLTVDFAQTWTHLENVYGDVIWETNSIVSVDPTSVHNKIKTILIFL